MSVTGSNPVQPAPADDEVEAVVDEMNDLYFSLTKALVDHDDLVLLVRVARDMQRFGRAINRITLVLQSMAARVAPAGEEDPCSERERTDGITASGSSGTAAG